MAANFILLALLDDNVIERNIVRHFVEELQNELPNNLYARRGIRWKNENYGIYKI